MQRVTFSTGLSAIPSFICNGSLNSIMPHLSFTHHAMVFISSAHLFSPLSYSLKTQYICMSLEGLPNRQKMFPSLPPLPAGQLCCLCLWAGQELYQTGNLQVALVIQASPCLIPHKQTPTRPNHHHHHPTLCAAHNSALHPLLSLA